MICWDTIYKYLKFEISFEETGLSLDELSSDMPLPGHDVLPFGMYIKGFDKILSGEIRFPAFKEWSFVACSTLCDYTGEEGNPISMLYNIWENFNQYASRCNAPKDVMLARVRHLKEIVLDNRDYLIDGLKEYTDVIDGFEERREHSKDEIEKYLSALNSLAEKGDFEAYNYLGTLYYAGRLVEQDYNKAKELYTLASEEGSTQGLINLGYIHYYARCGGDPNYEEAYKCFSKASKIGTEEEKVESLYKLSDMYDQGLYVKKQRKKAFDIVKRLYENEKDLYDSRFVADLAIRLGRAHSIDGVYPDPYSSLHYYTQALHFLEERFDGEWFGDKELIETAKKNIDFIKKVVYGEDFDGKTISPLQLERELNEYDNDFVFEDLIYDDERKELYLYLSSCGVRTIEHLGFTDRDIRMCVVIPTKRVTLNLKNIEENKYGNGLVKLWPFKINKKSMIHSWALVLGFFDSEDLLLARFSSKNEPGAYIGYIKDHDFDVVYEDDRYSPPKGFDDRYVIEFFLDYGEELLWSINEKAIERFGETPDIGSLGLSKGLEEDIQRMRDEFDTCMCGEEGNYNFDDRVEMQRFVDEVEKPIYERLIRELGEDYVIEFRD